MSRPSNGRYVPPLSTMESIVIASLAQGMHSKEIAGLVRRSKGTVEGYIRILFVKFDVRSRAQLVAAAYESGILHVEEPRSSRTSS